MIVGQDFLVASPVRSCRALLLLMPTPGFWAAIAGSAARIASGFGLACVAGVMGAALAAAIPLVDALLTPLVRAIRSVPVMSFIILVLLWASSSRLSLIVSFLMVLPVIYINVHEGIAARDTSLLEMADVFGVPTGRRLLPLQVPQVLPFFLAGARLAVGLAWKSGVSAEVIGLPHGSIGERLYQAKLFLNSADLFAWTVVIIALSYLFERVLFALFGLGRRRLGTVLDR